MQQCPGERHEAQRAQKSKVNDQASVMSVDIGPQHTFIAEELVIDTMLQVVGIPREVK